MIKRTSNDDLLAQIAGMDNLTQAWRKVRSNVAQARRAASCGMDEVSVAAFEQQWEANLAELSAALREQRYHPLPVRRVSIPKAGGKQRVIGVLAVRDRIAQRAAQQVLEPVFEAEFLDCSYGFRPGRSIESAVHRVLCYRQEGCAWIVKADIAHCFDSLDHGLLLRFVQETVHEGPVVDLVQAWLESGLLEVDAAVYAENSLWDRLLDGAAGMIRGQPQLPAGPWPELEEGDVPEGGAWQDDWQRQSLWRSVRSNLLLLGLSAIRPTLTQTTAGLRRLARGRHTRWVAAGLAGAAALGGVWWAVQHLAPHGVGALQGGALSPLLANVYLHRFDQQMIARPRNLVRYADDMVLCCQDEGQAREAAQDAARTLAGLRLRLNEDKTQVTSFDQGFHFLGHRFRGDGLAHSPAEWGRPRSYRG